MLARSYGQPKRKSTSETFPKNIFKPYSEIVEIDECDFFCQLNIVNNCLMTLLDDLIFINDNSPFVHCRQWGEKKAIFH